MQPKESDQNPEDQSPKMVPEKTPQQQSESGTPAVMQDVVVPTEPAVQQSAPEPSSLGEPKTPPVESSENDVNESFADETMTQSQSVTTSQSDEESKKPKEPKQPKQPKSASTKPLGFIAGVVIVAVSLMALVVMMYINQEQESVDSPATLPEVTAPIEEEMADPEPVVDGLLNDETDAPNNDVADDSEVGSEPESTDEGAEPEQPATQ